MNLVKTLHEICNNEGIEFRYSTKAGLNLLDNTEESIVYFCLLSPLKRTKEFGAYGSVVETTWSASAFLLTQSRIENTIYNENDNNVNEGKYAHNVLGLYDISDNLMQAFSVCGTNIIKWDDSETYDELDSNLDGLVIELVYKE